MIILSFPNIASKKCFILAMLTTWCTFHFQKCLLIIPEPSPSRKRGRMGDFQNREALEFRAIKAQVDYIMTGTSTVSNREKSYQPLYYDC